MNGKNSNKRIGTKFEADFCDLLASNGFWAHDFTQNQRGQPFDVICSKNELTYVIDCKVCSNDYFDLNRIEENQENSMLLWQKCGNNDGWFALKLVKQNKILMIKLNVLLNFRRKQSRMNLDELRTYSYLFSTWVQYAKSYNF